MRAEHDGAGAAGPSGESPDGPAAARREAAPEPAPAPKPASGPEAVAAGTGDGAGVPPGAARSRRFPSVTEGTVRPEGGGRAVSGAVSAPARQWPMLSVLAATAAGLLSTATSHPRFGCLLIGVALLAAAVLRRVLPSVGMLAVRSRFTDMVTYGVLGVAITLLALVMEPKPWLEIPFLETAVRFTVR
ncbi:DUF3017 domain-containing protein [Streptomyces sp. NPDC048507]|uniref:DUF3017 domain-containing protein n=1 Tax=Streptomyces sp. NPDC048507 TaxID=3365560 RepID=UPI0037132536